MKSGLEGRNNEDYLDRIDAVASAAMKSGLEGRNNQPQSGSLGIDLRAAMKSGLEGRNNLSVPALDIIVGGGRNEVRPRRPEQLARLGRPP